jgi:hypothetical protein
METPKPLPFAWLFRWKVWRVLLLVAASLVTLVALFDAEENWRGKRAWENYKEQKEARGVNFDYAKCVPPRVPDDQNFAMTPFLAPVFDFLPGAQQARDSNAVQRIYNAVQVPNAVQSQLNKAGWPEGISLDLVRVANTLEAPHRSAPPRFLPGQTQDAAKAILEKLKPAAAIFDELQNASRRPSSRFNIAYDWNPKFGILLPHLGVIKGLCYLLAVRGCAELALGQTGAVHQDVQLMFHLTDSLRNEPFLVSQLVRADCLTVALQPVWDGLAGHQWSDQQLEDIAQNLRKLDFLADDARALEAERCFGDSLFIELRAARNPISYVGDIADSQGTADFLSFLSRGFAGLLFPRGWYYLEELTYDKMYDGQINGVMTTNGIDPELAERRTGELIGKLGSGGFFSTLLHHRILSRMMLPALNNFERKMARAQDRASLALIACALERCRLANGQFPDTLNALVPRFLPVVPRDVIMGQPLIYRPTPAGQFILYSVGWNNKDDNGTYPRNDRSDTTNGDWVWKYPQQ